MNKKAQTYIIVTLIIVFLVGSLLLNSNIVITQRDGNIYTHKGESLKNELSNLGDYCLYNEVPCDEYYTDFLNNFRQLNPNIKIAYCIGEYNYNPFGFTHPAGTCKNGNLQLQVNYDGGFYRNDF